MNTELRITCNYQMHVIGLDIKTENLRFMFLADLTNDLCQSLCYCLNEHLTPILGTPHHVILAREVDIPVGLVGYLAHRDIIQLQAT